MTLAILLGLGCWLLIIGALWASPPLIFLGFAALLLGYGLAQL